MKTHLVVMASTFILFPLLILATMSVCGTFPTRADVAALEARTRAAAESSELAERNAERVLTAAIDAEVGDLGVSDDLGNLAKKEEIPANLVDADRRAVATGLWLGIFFLAALPSTVSSSVVMTNIARGNVPAAIFDASISSLLGVFVTPLWMRIFVDAETGGRDFGVVLLSLTMQAILPIILGVLANRRWGEFSRRNEKKLRKFDQSTIVLIVYTSFCHSFAEKMFDGLSGATLVGLSVGMIALFFVVFGIVYVVCRALRFNREDAITTLFCGSKKSLVHGVAISRVILSAPTLAGILILPTMVYHALQLIIVSVIAQRFAKIADREEAERAQNGANA